MMLWRKHRTLLIGLALIVLANAAALLGVAYNRSGEAESQLKLGQRELETSNRWRHVREESSLWLQLRWRVPQEARGERAAAWPAYYSGSPPWLDADKLRELGLELPRAEEPWRHSRRGLDKPVLLVLELDGPAYQRALQQARAAVAAEEALAGKLAGNPEFERRLREARQALAREENEHSRLFVVDAGLDLATLRARYPQRDRYAIVAGRVHAAPYYAGEPQRWTGYVSGVANVRINVPLHMRAPFEASVPAGQNSAVFEAVVAFGRRLEPWLVSARGAHP